MSGMLRALAGATGIIACAFSATSAWADCNRQLFNGFYMGVHGGYATFTSNQSDSTGYFQGNGALIAGSFIEKVATESGFVGGAQIGYNFRPSCATLFGIEADWSWAGVTATADLNAFSIPDAVQTMTTSLSSFGSIRTRTGVVMDNLLLYVTGGIAFADMDFKTQITLPGYGPGGSTWDLRNAFSDMRIGWTVGVGTEWALWGNLSLKSEVLYMHFGEKEYTTTGGNYTFSTIDSMWLSRVGLNYKF